VAEEFRFSELLKQADNSGFGIIPASDYDAVIDNAEVRETSTGKQKLACRFRIIGGAYNNRVLLNDFVLSPGSPNAMAIFFRHMAALGLDSAYFSRDPSLNRVADDLKDKEARIKVETRTWQGVERNGIAQVQPPRKNRGFEAPGGPAPVSASSAPAPVVNVAPTPPVMPDLPPPATPAKEEPKIATVEEVFGNIEIVKEDSPNGSATMVPPPPPPGLPF